MILETVLWWMPISDAMRFSAVPSACAERIDATTAAGFVVALAQGLVRPRIRMLIWWRCGPQ